MTTDNTGRVLTIRLTITDPEQAEWIWDSHKEAKHGVRVSAISNGDLFSERDKFADSAVFYIREEGETTEDAIKVHFDDGYNSPEDAARDANANVSHGAKWDIVNRHGTVYASGKRE